MADNINFNEITGRHSFVSKVELPWHRLGQIVDAMTSEEAMKLGGLDYEVVLKEITTYGGVIDTNEARLLDNVTKRTVYTGKKPNQVRNVSYHRANIIENRFATVRTDNHYPLGIVGSRYQPIQNWEAFDFFDKMIGEGHSQYETAGVLGNGETVFITAKLPEYIKVEGDTIDSYLLFTMAHDGSGAIQVMFTPIRVVCNNTLSMAVGSAKNKISIRHTKSAKDKLDNLDKVMGMTNDLKDELNNSFRILQDITVPDNKVTDLMIECLGLTPMEEDEKLSTRSENILKDALEYYKYGFGQREIMGTAYGFLNGVTGYLQNVKSFRGEESKFNSMLLKNGANDASGIRQRTFDKLISMRTKIFSGVFN